MNRKVFILILLIFLSGCISQIQTPPAFIDNYILTYPITAFFIKNIKQQDINVLGSFDEIATGITLNPSTSVTANIGKGRIFLAAAAGTDVNGTILINGTKVDRNNETETLNFLENLTITGLSIEVDGIQHTDIYMTDNWYHGDTILTTTDLNITDLHIYMIVFHQMNDASEFTIDSFEMRYLITDSGANMNTSLYAITTNGPVSPNIANITRIVNFNLLAGETADRYYSNKRTNINITLNGTKEGIFLISNFLPINQERFEDIQYYLWLKQPIINNNQ